MPTWERRRSLSYFLLVPRSIFMLRFGSRSIADSTCICLRHRRTCVDRGWGGEGGSTLPPLSPSLSLFSSPRSVCGWSIGSFGPALVVWSLDFRALRSCHAESKLPLLVSSPPARFGRTWGLTRGIYGSALGALRGGGWAFLLPACLYPCLALFSLLWT